MGEVKDRFMADVLRYIEAGDRLESALAAYNAMQREGLDDMRNGMTLSESCVQRDSAAWSRRITGLLDDFEVARRLVRNSSSATLKEEGRTVTEIGRIFGVSHQLAGRFANLSDGGDGAGPAEAPD